jgi:hypothetical protein
MECDVMINVKRDRYVKVVSELLETAHNMVPQSAVDGVVNRELVQLLDTISSLVDDHLQPARPYVEAMIHKSVFVAHAFQEVDA